MFVTLANITISIPQIEATVSARSKEIEAELAKLPELPTHNISQIVLQELARFSQQMQALMDGTDFTLHSLWNTLNNQLYEAFHEHLQPTFKVGEPRPPTNQMEMDGLEIISLDGDSPVLDRGGFDSPPNVRAPSAKEEPQLRSPKRFANGAEKYPNLPTKPKNPFLSKSFRENKLVASIGKIRETLAKYSKPGSLGHVDFKVKDELCMRAVRVWELPMEMYVDHVLAMLKEHAQRILGQVLSKWSQTELYKQAFQELEGFVNDFEGSMRETCQEILDIEFYRFFTINRRSFDHYVKVESKKIKDVRRKQRAMALAEQMMQGVNVRGDHNARTQMLHQKLKGIKDEDLGEDPFKIEIEVAAFVRGYYLTAADRVCDQICLTIHSDLFKQVHEKIFRYLEGKLGLDQGNSKFTFSQYCVFLMSC